MKGKELKKRMKRLCALVLAGMLALPATPIMAEEEQAKEAEVINVTDIRPGDILDPETVIKCQDQETVLIHYYDYSEKKYLETVDSFGYDNIEQCKILNYDKDDFSFSYGHVGQLNLDENDFAGWQVLDSDYYFDSCNDRYVIFLRALPKTEQKKTVTVHAVLGTDEKVKPETASETVQVKAEEPSVNLIAFDSKTGKCLKQDTSGNLTVNSGDLVYAYTTAVAGSYSKLDIYTGSGENKSECAQNWICKWELYTNRLYYQSSLFGDSKRLEFLPEDADAISAFIVPYTNVTVEAVYHEPDAKQTITYIQADYKSNEQPTVFHSEEVPVNGFYTVWKPESDQDTAEKDVLFWRDRLEEGVYKPGEKIRVKNRLEMIGNYVQDKTFSINCESGIKLYYHDVVNNSTNDKMEASKTDGGEKILAVLDPEKTKAGESAIGFAIKSDNGTKEVLFESGLTAGLAYDSKADKSLFDSSSTVSLKYAVQKAEDVLVDLSKEASLLQKPGKTDEKTWTIYGTICEKNAAYERTDIMELTDYMTEFEPYERYEYSDLAKGVTRKTLLDLNKDGTYDVAARIHAWSGDLTWTRLAGADACKEGTYVINMNRGGYGKLTIKVGEKQEDPKPVDKDDTDKKTNPGSDDKQGGEQKQSGGSEQKNAPGVGTEIKEPVTGNIYVVTKAATGTDENAAGEVKIKKVVLKKKAAIIPSVVVIDGFTYKVTSVDKNLLKGAAKAKSLDVGENITKLSAGLIKNAKKMKSLKIRNNKKVITLNKKFFAGRKGKIKLYVPKNLFKKYQKMIKKKKIKKFVTLKKY